MTTQTAALPVILIRNAMMVNEGQVRAVDMLIRQGHIACIASHIDHLGQHADIQIDAEGRWLLPGMIDDQVHFREPGMPDKGSIASESRAAVAGGITSFMDMPNTMPSTLNVDELERKKALAARNSVANYGFHFGVSHHNLDTIAALDPNSVAGIKVFMGASTGQMLVDDPVVLERLFRIAPAPLLAHCEHTPTIEQQQARFREHYERQHSEVPPDCHPLIRNADACYLSSSFAVELARRHNTRLHVLHISTARELSLFDAGSATDKRITAEACLAHLYFCDEDYARLGNLIKCNPAIKTAADRQALLTAVADGRIDVIGSDHAPHTRREKSRSYFEAPSGLPLVQHALPLLMQLYETGKMDLCTIVEKTSHRVADLFSIKDRGYLREGYWADLVLLERQQLAQSVHSSPVLYRCGWSALQQESFHYRVNTTIVSGQLAWHQGQLQEPCHGQALAFSR